MSCGNFKTRVVHTLRNDPEFMRVMEDPSFQDLDTCSQTFETD